MMFIYALVDPRTQQERYVGKADDIKHRLDRHLWSGRSDDKDIWVQELRKVGMRPIIRVLEEVATENWREKERYWVQRLLDEGCDLFNMNLVVLAKLQPAPDVMKSALGIIHREAYLTISDTAKALGLAESTIHNAVYEGRLAFVRMYGKKLIAREEMERYRLRTQPAGKKPRGRPAGSKNQAKSEDGQR